PPRVKDGPHAVTKAPQPPTPTAPGRGGALLAAKVARAAQQKDPDADALYWQAVGAFHMQNSAEQADALLTLEQQKDLRHARSLVGLGAKGIPEDAPPPLPTGGQFTVGNRAAPDGLVYPARMATPGMWVGQSHVHLPRPARVLVDLWSRASVRLYVDGVPLVF